MRAEVKWKRNVSRSEIKRIEEKLRKSKKCREILIVQTYNALEKEPEGIEIWDVERVLKEVKNRNSITKQKIADEIADNQIEKKEKNILAISPAKIKQLFTAGSGELFDFIENYEFPTDLSLEQKTTLFCKIASRYSDELIHTKEYKTFNDIEYAVIKSKN